MSRFAKQAVYGLIYLALFSLLGFGAYYLWFRPTATCFDGIQNQNETGIDCGGVCGNVCMPPDFKNLDVSVPKIFKTGDQVNVLTEIKNYNQTLAARKVDYMLTLFDKSGTPLESHPGSFFIYAGQIRFISDFIATQNAQKVASADVTLKNPAWVAASAFPASQIRILDKNVAAGNSSIKISGHVQNADLVGLDNVTVLVILRGTYGEMDGISATNFDHIDFGSTLPFTVTHPPIAGLSRADVYVYAVHP